MMIIGKLITLVILVILILWLLRLKKNDPFPKSTIPKVIVGGLISVVLSALISMILVLVYAVIRYGPVTIMQVIQETAAGNREALDGIRKAEPSIWYALLQAVVFIGLVEEFLKFSSMRHISKKPGTINNRFDAVVMCALSGIGFQIFENFTAASSGGIGVAVMRAIMPFHFTLGVIMGYLYGKYLDTRKGKDLFLTFAIPIIIHGLYDLCVLNITEFANMFIFAFLAFVTVFVMTIVVIVKVNKWSKKESMREPFSDR